MRMGFLSFFILPVRSVGRREGEKEGGREGGREEQML